MFKKLFCYLFCFNLMFSTIPNSFSENTISIPKVNFVEMLSRLKDLKKIESSFPIVEIVETPTIVVDFDGRVYFKPEVLKLKFKLEYLNYEISIPLEAQVYRNKPPKKFFDLKFKVGFLKSLKQDSISGVFLVSPFSYRNFSPNIYLGNKSAGLVISMDVLKNTGPYIGTGYDYEYSNLDLVFGVFFNLN